MFVALPETGVIPNFCKKRRDLVSTHDFNRGRPRQIGKSTVSTVFKRLAKPVKTVKTV